MVSQQEYDVERRLREEAMHRLEEMEKEMERMRREFEQRHYSVHQREVRCAQEEQQLREEQQHLALVWQKQKEVARALAERQAEIGRREALVAAAQAQISSCTTTSGTTAAHTHEAQAAQTQPSMRPTEALQSAGAGVKEMQAAQFQALQQHSERAGFHRAQKERARLVRTERKYAELPRYQQKCIVKDRVGFIEEHIRLIATRICRAWSQAMQQKLAVKEDQRNLQQRSHPKRPRAGGGYLNQQAPQRADGNRAGRFRAANSSGEATSIAATEPRAAGCAENSVFYGSSVVCMRVVWTG